MFNIQSKLCNPGNITLTGTKIGEREEIIFVDSNPGDNPRKNAQAEGLIVEI